jgi:S1-C subfamily serine protease
MTIGGKVGRVWSILCIVAALVVALPTSHAVAAEQLDLADLIEKVDQSIVRIDVTMEDGRAIGSGYVVDESGIIATNYHVMAGAKEATAVFKDGQKYPVKGTLMLDGKRDIAIIKIEKPGLIALELADVLPRKGESVVTFGAPQGLSFSASEGIVSGIREGKELTDYVADLPGTWIQTTAPISGGNSGGPLVKRDGRVTGMNTMVLLTGQNLNFAISSVDVGDVLKQARTQKLVALSEGAAKAKEAHKRPKRSNDMIPEDVPIASIDGYIASGKGGRTNKVADMRKTLRDAREKLSGFKAGQISGVAMQAQTEGAAYVVNVIRNQKYYLFPDSETKDKVCKEQQKKLTEIEELVKKVEDPKDGLLSYLTKAGPDLPLNTVGEVGCVPELTVAKIIGDDEFITIVDRKPVTVRGIKTASLANGSKLDGRVMYVSGNWTIVGESVGIHTMFVLRELPSDLIASRIAATEPAAKGGAVAKSTPDAKSSQPAAGTTAATPATTKPDTAPVAGKEPEFRMWTDKSGKFKIEAKLLAKTADKVVLQKRDGEPLTVPTAVLSQADLDFLK